MKIFEILQKIKIDYRRVAVGIVFLVLELCLLFGSGALLEDEVHMLTGEGSREVAFSDGAPMISQEFVPAHKNLKYVSFRMELTGLTQWDNEVTVTVQDQEGAILFERVMDIQEITDGAYTDVDVNLELDLFESYYLNIAVTPTSAGEYPVISVCSTDYELPESRSLTFGDEMADTHLVSRYQYVDGLPLSRAFKAVILCLVVAFGIMFGLPKNNYVRKAVGVVLLLAAPYVLGQRLELLTYDAAFYLPHAMKWNLIIMYGLELVVLLATHSTAVSVVLTNVFLTLLYSVNFYVLMFRGTSLRMNDLTAIGTATDVMGDFDLTPNSHLAFVWAIALILVVYGVQTGNVRSFKTVKRTVASGETAAATGKEEVTADREGKKRCILWKVVSYVVTIALAVFITFYGGHTLLYTDYLEVQQGFAGKHFIGFTHQLIYSFNGYLVGTCVEVKNSRITKPEGYSVEAIEEILAPESEEEVAEDLPHIILVMNESLADVRTVADVELNQENMTFMKSLEENTIKGYTNVSTFGGGTANSEFEVFTGCSMSFLPVNYYPYQQALRKPLNSMVSQMEAYGYTTIAMHPERQSNWNRENVYKYYGFDQMLFQQDFADAEIIHSGVSDKETFNRIIDLYENRTEGEKLFVFDLTMQNHGGYEQSEWPDEVQAVNVDEPQLDEYLSLIKVTDEAFEDLVHYFEEQDEKVIICMYGDHQPWIFDLVVGTGMTDGNEPSESMMNKYRTPFVLWANYDIEEAEGYDISLNYLGGLVMRTAGVPLSPYFAYLEELRKEYPIITINGYVDDEGTYANWSGESNEFPEYRMLQYNYLFADDTVEWGY